MDPAVSVIVPVFNTRDLLPRCLASIAAQTFRDFEAIVVDDGSTDGSAEVAEAFCRQDPRFRLLRHGANRGLAAARNTGLRAARGEWMASVDSDDAALPDMLATVHAAATEGDFDVVAGGLREVDMAGAVLRTVLPPARTVVFDGPPRDLFALTDPGMPTKLWRRRIPVDHGIWFVEGRRYEDLGWTYRVLMHCRRIRILDHALFDYTIRTGSQTHSFGWDALVEHIAAFEVLHGAMTEAGLVEHNLASFHARVRASLAYHAWNVCALLPPSEDRLRYLRGILAISQAYGQEDPGAFRPDDVTPIIGAIERGGTEGHDLTIAALRERIRILTAETEALKAEAQMRQGEAATLRALANDIAATLRGPIFLLRPLAALCAALARLGPAAGLKERAARLRGLRARLADLNRPG